MTTPNLDKLPLPAFEKKICSVENLQEALARLPKPIVFTNGVFDILHRGHVSYLAQAKSLGASLVLGVNADSSVRLLGKGDDRPLNAQDDRMALLAALETDAFYIGAIGSRRNNLLRLFGFVLASNKSFSTAIIDYVTQFIGGESRRAGCIDESCIVASP